MSEILDVLSRIPHDYNFSITDTISLSHTCKQLHSLYMRDWSTKKIGIKGQELTLKLEQYIFCAKAHEAFKHMDICILSCMMGFGKTICSIYYMMKFHKFGNVLITVPPNCLKTWIAELTRVGLLKAKPMESEVLVYHSIRPNHQKLVSEETNMFLYNRIILTSDNNTAKIKGDISLMIRDEYHKPTKMGLRDFTSDTPYKILGLTGNDIVPCFDYRILKLKDVDFGEKIPQVDFRYYNVDNGKDDKYCKYKFHIEDVYSYADEYEREVTNCITSKDKVVIFVDRGDIGTLVREWVSKLYEYKVFELKSSNNTLKTFNVYRDKAILFILSSANEGLNVFEEHMIIIKPDMMATDRIIQSLGRLRRPLNPYPVVTCNFIVGGKVALIKSFYAACYSTISWDLGHENSPPESFLLKCAGIIGLFGFTNVTDFPKVDGCVVFDAIHTRERYELVSKWWLANKTSDSVLTIDHINALYI